MEHEASLLSNPIVWYTLGIAIFFFGIWKARGPILGMLDAEIAKVRAELDQARKLRAEAEATMADYERRHKDALLEAEAILAQAKADAEKLRAEAEEELEQSLRFQEKQAVARIKDAEHAAIHEVRTLVIEQAMEGARKALDGKLDAKKEQALIDDAIKAIAQLGDASKVA
jgi:F-type H+-transporting ATPase subunit b